MTLSRNIVVLGLLLATGCTTQPSGPPLVTSGHRSAQLPRDRAYLACASRTYRRYARLDGLRLRQRYAMRRWEDDGLLEIHLEGLVRGDGGWCRVGFVCHAEAAPDPAVVRLVADFSPGEPSRRSNHCRREPPR